MGMADWSELPHPAIALLVKLLWPCLEEIDSLASVCKSWRWVAVHEKQRLQRPFVPYLMLTRSDNDDKATRRSRIGVRRCYNLYSGRLLKFDLPQLQGTKCWGTPYGWLVTFCAYDSQIKLFNPLTDTNNCFSLPPKSAFKARRRVVYSDVHHLFLVFAVRFALSSNPSHSGRSLVVMAILGEQYELAFASPGDKAWTSLESPNSNADVIFFKDHFYAINHECILRICNIDDTSNKPYTRDIADAPPDFWSASDLYLVSISGNLHLVIRELFEDVTTENFHVYKFNFDMKKWSAVEDLGGHAVFVGNNMTFAISTSEYPQLKSNSIYFTHDRPENYYYGFCDMGVFDFKNKTIEPLYEPSNYRISKFCRPFFFQPAFS